MLSALASRIYADFAHNIFVAFELHDSVNQSEERIVTASADVLAGMQFRTALAHQNAACLHGLSTELLDAKSLRVTVSSVTRATYTFFMCQLDSPPPGPQVEPETYLVANKIKSERAYPEALLELDLLDQNLSVRLSMAESAMLVLLGLICESNDLLAFDVADYLCGNLCAFNDGRTHLVALITTDEQYIAELDSLSSGGIQLFNLDCFILSDGVLLTAGSQNCIHKRACSFRTVCRNSFGLGLTTSEPWHVIISRGVLSRIFR